VEMKYFLFPLSNSSTIFKYVAMGSGKDFNDTHLIGRPLSHNSQGGGG
jgi:hypothetical protein